MTYLDSFVSTAISASYLQAIAADFEVVRQAGLKAIVRYAYTDNGSTQPYGDATKAQVLAHISQLAPIWNAYSDVIAVFQAGFIGA